MQKAKHHFGRLNASNGEHGRMSPRMVSHGLNVSLHPKPPRTQHLPRGGCIIFIFDSTAQHELFLLSFFSSKKSVLRDYAAAPFGYLKCLKSNFWMYCGLWRPISLGVSSQTRIRDQKKRVGMLCIRYASLGSFSFITEKGEYYVSWRVRCFS